MVTISDEELSEIGSNVYVTQSDVDQKASDAKLLATLQQLGAKDPRTLVRKIKTYKGNCWFCWAVHKLPREELLSHLNGTCLDRPPSKWPCKDDGD